MHNENEIKTRQVGMQKFRYCNITKNSGNDISDFVISSLIHIKECTKMQADKKQDKKLNVIH